MLEESKQRKTTDYRERDEEFLSRRVIATYDSRAASVVENNSSCDRSILGVRWAAAAGGRPRPVHTPSPNSRERFPPAKLVRPPSMKIIVTGGAPSSARICSCSGCPRVQSIGLSTGSCGRPPWQLPAPRRPSVEFWAPVSAHRRRRLVLPRVSSYSAAARCPSRSLEISYPNYVTGCLAMWQAQLRALRARLIGIER